MRISVSANTLTGRYIRRLGLVIALILLLSSILGYAYWYQVLSQQRLHGLVDYIGARVEGESEQFLLAETQTRMMTDEFLQRYRDPRPIDYEAAFDRIFSVYPDGLVRVRPDVNDYRRKATMFIRHDVALTADLKKRSVIGYNLLSEWGPLTTNRFLDSFMNMPEQLSINYAPFVDWSMAAQRDTDIYIYETVWRSTLEKNPARKPFWTGVYFDEGARKWMVSHVTPGDSEGRWVISSGQDIVVDDLIRRSSNQQLEGTYNLILRPDGQLIAHPKLVAQIQKAGGNLDVNRLGDKSLSDIVDSALKASRFPSVVETTDGDAWLVVAQIRGPGWIWVTVYPKTLLRAEVASHGWLAGALAIASMLVLLSLVLFTLQKQISQPLRMILQRIEAVGQGKRLPAVAWDYDDEIGRVLGEIQRMEQVLQERDEQLACSTDELLQQVRKANNSVARLAALSDSLPDPVFLIEADGTVAAAFGEPNLFATANPVGLNVADVLPPELTSESKLIIQRVIDTGHSEKTEYPLLINGQPRWFEGVVRKATLSVHDHPAVLWLARDITQRKQNEIDMRMARDHLQDIVDVQTADLIKARDRANAANMAKTQFLSNVSHELRTPMHAILSFARLGLDKGSELNTDKARRYFTNIVDSGERMLALVNDLLDIEKLEAGKMLFQIQPNQLPHIIDSVLVEMENLIARHRIEMRVDCQPDYAQLDCDALRMGQLLRNLLSNAIKFSPEGGEVLIRVQDGGNGSVLIAVEDQGEGIMESEKEALFQKFTQSNRHLDRPGGTGLGLAICREIARGHGGEIWVENRPEGGASFKVRLPRFALAAERQET